VDILRERLKTGDLRRTTQGEDLSDQIMDLLVSNPMFSNFGAEELRTVSQYLSLYEAPKGATVIKEGEPGQFLCLLVEGRLCIHKNTSEEGKTKKITMMRPGKSFAEMAVIDGLPYSASAIAEEDSKVLVLTRDKLEKISEVHPKVGVKLIWQLAKLISQRLRQTTGVLVDHAG
jgi:CRP-like cAMP-binding protein